MAENPKVNLALVNDIPDGNLEQGTIYMSPDVSGNFIKVAVTDSSTVTIFDGSAYATKQQVTDNEYVVATALNDLNNRIDNIDVELLTNITYSELKALRDTSTLVPGMRYRITDYECTTSAENTSVGGHAFDIIVTADSSSKLNENARAIQNKDENYFDNANLLAWELKYAIDNNSVYSWASQDGKGVVYYMKDEFDNECGYDFKNIKFAFVDSSSALIDSSTHYYYTFTDASTDNDLSMKKDSSTICEKNYIMAINDGSVFTLPHTVFIASNSVFNNTIKRASNNVFGAAYNNDMGMIEDCVFDNVFDLNTVETALNTWLKGVAEVNHIKYISNSEFGNNFAFNTIRYMSNTKAGDGFMLNDVGDYFINSSFGNNCFSNFFGPYSGTITTGNDFAENTMQNQCHHLTFGNSCKFNNMGTVGYVRMGNNCTDNFIGNGKYIYFGNSSNQGADWICGNKFEGITQYVYFYNTGSASLSNMLRKYHMYNICGTSDSWKSISETTRNNSKETFVLTRPGYTTPAANSLIYVDPAMLPERTKGGTAGQILVKISGTDYDMGWRTVNIGSQIAYDSSNKVISLKDASGNVLGTPVDATDFIKDGMVSDVSVYGGNLVISFNTDAGKEDIAIPLADIFDSSNYYTKSETDAMFEDMALTTAAALNDLNERIPDMSSYVKKDELEEVELSTAMALNDLDSRISDASSSSPWESGNGENSAQLRGTTGATGDGAVAHAYGSNEETIETPSWYIGRGYESEDYNYYNVYNYNGNGIDHEPWDTIIYNNNRYAVTSKSYSQFSTDPPLGINGNTQAYVSIVLPPAGLGEASGLYSHTEGEVTNAKGDYSHAEGTGKISYLSPLAAIYNVEEDEWMFGNIDSEVYNCCLVFRGNYYYSDDTPALNNVFENCAMSLYRQYKYGDNVSLELYNSTSFTPDNFICDIFANGDVEEYTYDDGEGGYYHGLLFYNSDIISGISDSINVYSELPNGAIGTYSHSEGLCTAAYSEGSHTEGAYTIVSNDANYAHAEGILTAANGEGSHAEGLNTVAQMNYSHAEGAHTTANGEGTHTEGLNTYAEGIYSHAEGKDTSTLTAYSHAEGRSTVSKGSLSHAEGYNTLAYGVGSHAEGRAINAAYAYNYYSNNGRYLYRVSNNYNSKYRLTPDASIYGAGSGYFDFTIKNGSLLFVNNEYCHVKNLDSSGFFDLYQFYSYDENVGTGNEQRYTVNAPVYDPNNVDTTMQVYLVSENVAYGGYSSLSGYQNTAIGDYSHAEGNTVLANKYSSHAEGYKTITDASYSHAEGFNTVTTGLYSHTEGFGTVADGLHSHAEGGGDSSNATDISYANIRFAPLDSSYVPSGCYGYIIHDVNNYNSLNIGNYLYDNTGSYIRILNKGTISNYYPIYYIITDKPIFLPYSKLLSQTYTAVAYRIPVLNGLAAGISSHAEGIKNIAYGVGSHAEGANTIAYGTGSHSSGYGYDIHAADAAVQGNAGATVYTLVHNNNSAIYPGEVICYKGRFAKIVNITDSSVTFDKTLDASYPVTSTDKLLIFNNCAYGNYSSTAGLNTIAYGDYSHAEGLYSIASNTGSHAEGIYSIASGAYSHAEGWFAKAAGDLSYAKGVNTLASDYCSHASGVCSQATGASSEATGYSTLAQGSNSHAEGQYAIASGAASHSEGFWTNASGSNSHAEGAYTIASGIASHAEGGMYYKSISVRSFSRSGSDASLYSISYYSSSGSVTDITGIIYPGYTIISTEDIQGSGVEARRVKYTAAKVLEIVNKYYIRLDKDLNPGGSFTAYNIKYIPYDITAVGAKGTGSHAEGIGTIALNDVEHAQGQFNISHKDTSVFGDANNTIHTIGIGISDSSRANAVEVMRNGDIYITGIGNYDGSNYLNASTLQEVVNAGGSGGGSTDIMTNITYSALKNLRDTSALTPGMQYLISDYVTTTDDVSVTSAEHPFGVIVTADSSSILNEIARIIDLTNSYYSTCNLDAYEIKYCLDNDSSRFGWADPNGKGVIYYMKDDNRNEACYDFTNILFDNKYTFDYNGTDARLNASANIHDNVIGPHYGGYTSASSQQTYYTLSPNNIVFEGLMNYNNTFGKDCYDLKFANQTMFNTFDGAVWDCSFGTTTIYNHFGSYITGNVFPAKLATSDIGSNTWYVNVSGTTSYIRCIIMPNTKGTSTSSRLSISITETGQHAGLNSSGVLKKWLPADLIN